MAQQLSKTLTPINGISAFTKLFSARKTQKTISTLLRATSITGSLLVFAVFLLIISGCSNRETRENNELRDEIIVVHDEAMDKIGLLYQLQTRLTLKPEKQEKNSLERQSCIEELQQADEAMFAWMRQYRTLAVDNDPGIDTQYRRDQLEQIREVKKVMERAVHQAEIFLKNTQ